MYAVLWLFSTLLPLVTSLKCPVAAVKVFDHANCSDKCLMGNHEEDFYQNHWDPNPVIKVDTGNFLQVKRKHVLLLCLKINFSLCFHLTSHAVLPGL